MRLLGNRRLCGSKRIMAALLSAALTVGGMTGTVAFAGEIADINAENMKVIDAGYDEVSSEETDAAVIDEAASVTASTDADSAPLIDLNTTTSINGMTPGNTYYVKFSTEGKNDGYFQYTLNQAGDLVDKSGVDHALLDDSKQEIVSFDSHRQSTVTSDKYGFERGVFYLKLSIDRYSGVNDFSLSVRIDYTEADNWEKEYNNTADKATEIEINKEYIGNMYRRSYAGRNEKDWYKFTVPDQATNPGYFNVSFYNGNGKGEWYYFLMDKDQHQVYESGEFGDANQTSPNFGFSGQTMYLCVYSSYSDEAGLDYKIKVNYVSDSHYESEYNDTIETANDLVMGEKKQGLLHVNKTGDNDCDYYKFTVPESENCTVHLYHNNGDLNYGWKVTVLNSDNSTVTDFVAKTSGDTSSDSVALSTGTYYVKIEAEWFTYVKELPYFISVEEGAANESGDQDSGSGSGNQDSGSVSENQYSGAVSENRGDYSIGFNNEIIFWGDTKKFTNESDINKVFGEVSINWNGKVYKATSIKVSKKKDGNNYIQILQTDNSDSNFNKGIKKLTKGTSGLKFTIKPLKITEAKAKDIVTVTVKNGKVKKVMVKTKGPKAYKAKKNKDYTYSGSDITFTGKNLEGSCKF